MSSGLPWWTALIATCAVPAAVSAAPAAKAEGKASVGSEGVKAEGGGATEGAVSKRKHERWIRRWAPERNTGAIGAAAGVLVIPPDHELFSTDIARDRQGFLPLRRAAVDLALRFGYFPLSFLGIEAEGSFAPTRTDASGRAAFLYGARGHIVGQVPYTITPFALFGAGALGVQSNDAALGVDVDPELHVGIGAKIYFNRWLHGRLDLRDYITPRRGIGGATNWLEATIGLGITFGRKRDRDQAEATPTPKPELMRDRDGDGWFDDDDNCPDEAGVEPDGCPPPPDRDDDGFADAEDRCPDEPGIEPDGCPDLDPDRDGVLSDADACPDVAETHNGFEDSDGCPDEVPSELSSFEGTLAGVEFDLGSAKLGKGSRKTLDAAVAVLEKFPEIRVEISGHTDSSGDRDKNMALSDARATSVKTYLVGKGIAEDRVQTRGAGPDEPVDSNASKPGRARNRRIEFRVLD